VGNRIARSRRYSLHFEARHTDTKHKVSRVFFSCVVVVFTMPVNRNRSNNVTKHFFSACSIVASNVDLTYLNATKPMKIILYGCVVTTNLFPCTSYIACQPQSDFALSIKQHITCCRSARFLLCEDPNFISSQQAKFFFFF
jgi:hypothetical protein